MKDWMLLAIGICRRARECDGCPLNIDHGCFALETPCRWDMDVLKTRLTGDPALEELYRCLKETRETSMPYRPEDCGFCGLADDCGEIRSRTVITWDIKSVWDTLQGLSWMCRAMGGCDECIFYRHDAWPRCTFDGAPMFWGGMREFGGADDVSSMDDPG